MEETNKVFVFEKKELFLVFIFVFILCVICFTLGVRLGKKLSLEGAGITASDQAAVELKSDLEEAAEAPSEEDKLSDEEKLNKLMDDSKNKLNEEIKDTSSEEKPAPQVEKVPSTQVVPSPVTTKPTPSNVASPYTGKYTIQLGSYNTADEAKQFAEGFSVRGYNPIVNEVVIPNKGVWYRVSLGVFDSTEEAKNYIKKEQSLFQGQNYIISEIQ
jgi:cell division septation protein DedD